MSEEHFAFKVVDNQALPYILVGDEEIDGANFLNVDQAVDRFGGTAAGYRAKWEQINGHYLRSLGAGDNFAKQHAQILSMAAWDVIFRVRFPHVKENDHREFVKNNCIQRGLDPNDIWVEMRFNRDRDKLEPVIITTLQALRQLAERSGEFEGEHSPEFCDAEGNWTRWPWLKETPPVAARIKVSRRGRPDVIGQALWDRCARFTIVDEGKLLYEDAWEPKRGGADQLLKCARADGIRARFSEETGQVVTRDERLFENSPKKPSPLRVDVQTKETFDSSTGEVVAKGVVPVMRSVIEIPDDPRAWVDLVDDTTPPMSRLPLELMLAGVAKNESIARSLIDEQRKRWPRLSRHSDPRFFVAAVLKSVA